MPYGDHITLTSFDWACVKFLLPTSDVIVVTILQQPAPVLMDLVYRHGYRCRMPAVVIIYASCGLHLSVVYLCCYAGRGLLPEGALYLL